MHVHPRLDILRRCSDVLAVFNNGGALFNILYSNFVIDADILKRSQRAYASALFGETDLLSLFNGLNDDGGIVPVVD
jgi:hypothetical protein